MTFLSQRQEEADYEYESDYGEQDESEAALGLPNDSISIRENIGNFHTSFHLRFLKP